jgi:hypothetical protein
LTEASAEEGGGGDDEGAAGASSLVAVAYPQAADVSNAPAQILGDDSLLLK